MHAVALRALTVGIISPPPTRHLSIAAILHGKGKVEAVHTLPLQYGRPPHDLVTIHRDLIFGLNRAQYTAHTKNADLPECTNPHMNNNRIHKIQSIYKDLRIQAPIDARASEGIRHPSQSAQRTMSSKHHAPPWACNDRADIHTRKGHTTNITLKHTRIWPLMMPKDAEPIHVPQEGRRYTLLLRVSEHYAKNNDPKCKGMSEIQHTTAIQLQSPHTP